jgi:C-terminal processing protease CtpA/Prc
MYSSFDLRHVDWRAQYDAYRPAITPATTPSALFGTLCEMVRPLDDPHVNVGLSDEEVCSSRALPSWFEGRQDAILAAHDEALGADGMQRAGGQLTYGTLRGRFGYVSIPSMSGFGDTPDTDQQTAEAAIDEVVAASAELDGMVVDVRFNDGGSDGIALALAARFADRKRFAFSVETRDGSGWTPRRDYYVQPAGERQFEKPVVLLTSALTVSAAEIFTLAMRTLPHVTVVGETTAGGHSTMTLRNLPNGFGFTLPFERVFAADGVCYEGVGLDPSLSVAFDPDAFVAGDDTMLTAALEVLEGG